MIKYTKAHQNKPVTHTPVWLCGATRLKQIAGKKIKYIGYIFFKTFLKMRQAENYRYRSLSSEVFVTLQVKNEIKTQEMI